MMKIFDGVRLVRARSVSVVALSAFVVVATAACGEAGAPTSVGSASPSASPTVTIDAQRSKEYRSVGELDSEATMVVLATAGSTRPDEADPDDPTDIARLYSSTTMTVDRVLRGDYAAPTFVLHTLGGEGIAVSDLPSSLREGSRYLLWVKHDLEPGAPADSFYPVGDGVGIFAFDGKSARKLDQGSPRLPATVSVPPLAASERTAAVAEE